MKKNICVIGLGYIGLPTLLLFSKQNFNTLGIDINKKLISNIIDYKNYSTEKNIKKLLSEIIKKKNFTLSNNYKLAKNYSTYIICVPTPILRNKNRIKPDLSHLMKVIHELKKIIKKNDTVIIESTVPVGTTDKVKEILLNNKFNETDINIAYCPERVLPGNILAELKSNDRIIGGINSKSNSIINKLYKSFVNGNIYLTNPKTAEMIKLSENSFRDVNIAFANEISLICSKYEIDVREVIKLANKHPRVNILDSGIGVGGHCIPVDPWFLIDNKKNTKLLKTARNVNNDKTLFIIREIKKNIIKYKKKFKKIPSISLLGLTYKKDVNDIRNSPSLKIFNNLYKEYQKIYLVDPFIKTYKNHSIYSANFAIKNSQIIIILINHSVFKKLLTKNNLKNKIIIDYCNINIKS